MQITRTSPFTGAVNTREIAVTQAQLDAWQGGELIQVAMPHLSADDREFLMTGITPEEWDAAFGSSDEDEDEDEGSDGFRDDVEADADTLASAGYGTDEDYGYYGDDGCDW